MTQQLTTEAPREAPLSGGGSRGVSLVVVATLLVLAAAVVASVLVGARWVPLSAVLDTGDELHGIISARVDRTVLAVVVGASLGLVGALMQGLTRNPLADPGILGINAGASLAMVIAISTLHFTDLRSYVWFGFAGAAVAMVLVHVVAMLGRDGATPMKIAIAGAAVTAAVTSWTQAVLLTDRTTIEAFRLWSVGTVGGRGTDVLVVGLPFIVVGVLLALLSIGSLNALALGDDLARGLGRRVAIDRFVIALAVVLMAGACTALAGPIAFVGLIVPHAVRALVGPDYRRVLPLSMGFGATLLLVADTVGRVVLPPSEVQVGIMTAVIGAPVFLVLIRRGRMGAL